MSTLALTGKEMGPMVVHVTTTVWNGTMFLLQADVKALLSTLPPAELAVLAGRLDR